MVVCAAGNYAETVHRKCSGEHRCVGKGALHIGSEGGIEGEREANRLRRNDVQQWASLAPRKDALVERRSVCGARERNPAACAA